MDKTIKTVSERKKHNRLLEAPASTVIEKTALEFAAVFYDAARSSGATSKMTQKAWARKNFHKFIPRAVQTLISMLGRSDISDLMKQEIHTALIERINDPEMIMIDDLAKEHLQDNKLKVTEH